MGLSLETLVISKKYTRDTISGAGAVAGVPCKIQSITDITRGKRVTFLWDDNAGTSHTSVMDVKDGLGIKAVEIQDVEGEDHLIVTYDDDTTEDAGRVSGGAVNYPELVAPSATISTTGNTLLECGSTLSTAIKIEFDRGKIDPAYGTSGYRSGAATGYTLDGTTQMSGTFAVTVTEAKTSYQGSVSYAAGEQPKDSDGEDYDSPLAAGSVNTETLEFEFVNAVWANTEHIDTVAKLPLISKEGGMVELDFPAQTSSDPEEFHLPSDWTNVVIYTRFPYGEEMQDVTSEFDVSTVGHDDASGTEVTYTKYRDNRGYAADARTLLITWH